MTVVKVDLLHRTCLMHYEHGMHVYWNRAVFYCDYNAPRRCGALSYAAIRPSVCLSVPPEPAIRCAYIREQRLDKLGAQLPTRAVRTADRSAHGRRSAAIGGGISSLRAITCYVFVTSRLLFDDTIQHVVVTVCERHCNENEMFSNWSLNNTPIKQKKNSHTAFPVSNE